MNVGMIGLGKLGLPVAVAIGQHQRVIGYDINDKLLCKREYEHTEHGLDKQTFQEMFRKADISFTSLNAVAAQCDLIFVAVQTPHQPKYEGVTRIPEERADFDYTYLENAVRDLAQSPNLRPETVVVVISTCLPGTIRERILPLIQGRARLVYNPFFIAMGTVVHDFYNPEFILLGGDPSGCAYVEAFYSNLFLSRRNKLPRYRKMSIESAELTKVAYNTFIGMKIAYANTMMEIAHKIPGCNVDHVMDAIKSATDRLISTKYLNPGMGDGGGCHPRDNIAMSWLSKKLDMGYDFFQYIMKTREQQAEWLAHLMTTCQMNTSQFPEYMAPLVIMGKAFKPDVGITTGSPALLVSRILIEWGADHKIYDPYIDGQNGVPMTEPAIFLIGTKHGTFALYKFPKGSIVIDPHRYIPDQEGVRVIRVGARE